MRTKKVKIDDLFDRWPKQTGRFAWVDRSRCASCGHTITGVTFWNRQNRFRLCGKCAKEYVRKVNAKTAEANGK